MMTENECPMVRLRLVDRGDGVLLGRVLSGALPAGHVWECVVALGELSGHDAGPGPLSLPPAEAMERCGVSSGWTVGEIVASGAEWLRPLADGSGRDPGVTPDSGVALDGPQERPTTEGSC